MSRRGLPGGTWRPRGGWLPVGLAMACALAHSAADATDNSEPPRPSVRPPSTHPNRPGPGARVRPDASATRDGVYGRLDGDLDLGIELGGELQDGGARAAGRVIAYYFSMVGAYLMVQDSFGADSLPPRTLSLGVDLRPTFVPRWAQNLQQGPSSLDLAIDSLSVGMGAFWERPPTGSFGARRGFEASLGFGLPLLGTAPGPWAAVRGLLRWPEGIGVGTPSARPSLLVTLGWHVFMLTPLAPAAD